MSFKINNGLITSPGKFEGEPIFVPVFWEYVLNGEADYQSWDEDTETCHFVFRLNREDHKNYPLTQGHNRLTIWEDDQGFVWHHLWSD